MVETYINLEGHIVIHLDTEIIQTFDNGEYKYEDKEGIQHLIRDGKELCNGTFVYSCSGGSYGYFAKDGKMYHIEKELTHEELKEIHDKEYGIGHTYANGDYDYEDEEGIEHLIRDGKELCKGVWVYSFDNGDYEYSDEEGIEHYVRKEDIVDTLKVKDAVISREPMMDVDIDSFTDINRNNNLIPVNDVLLHNNSEGAVKIEYTGDHCWDIVTSFNYNKLNNEEKKMELKDMKKSNLKAAKDLVNEERMNEEIAEAKAQYAELRDRVDELDRQIKVANDEKKELMKDLKLFDAK